MLLRGGRAGETMQIKLLKVYGQLMNNVSRDMIDVVGFAGFVNRLHGEEKNGMLPICCGGKARLVDE